MTRFLSSIQVAFALTMVSGVAYAEETYDLGDLVPGEVYEYPAMTTVTGRYTPSQTGPVKFMFSRAPLGLFTTPNYQEGSEVGFEFSYVDGQQMRMYSELQEGTTYYVMGRTLDYSTMQIFEGTTQLEVVGVSPKLNEDDYFSVSSNYTIDVAFNTPIKVSNALILVGKERSTVSYTVSGTYVTCDVASAIMTMYREGKINKGDVMTLRLVSVTDAYDPNNKYNGNGKLEMEFLMPDKPAELVSVVNASLSNLENPFMSYYASEDPAARISFIFDSPIAAEGAVAKISYGNPDLVDVGVYTEDIPGVVTDNTVEFDFSGKLRRPIDMLPASTSDSQPSSLGILFSNIYTEDGQRVFTNRQTNPSGFPLSFKINTLQYTISTDYTPGRGSKLEFGEEMEIWVMNGKYVYSSGIQFDYTEGGEPKTFVVPMPEVNVEPDPIAEDDMIYTFKIPALKADEGTPVIVSFANLECSDGLDHSGELTAEFGYDTTGVEDVTVSANDDAVTVYNAAGVCILRNADRAALTSLPKGLYIVNGKKTIL